jgi:uncharacterized protein (DUF1330 family)
MAVPGYLLVIGHSLDGAKMAQYSAELPPIYKKYGGFYLGIGGPGRGVELLEGAWFDHSMVLAQFAHKIDIGHFWNSPEYTQAKQLRKGGGVFNVFALNGNEHAAPKGQPSFMVTIYRPFDEFKTNELNAKEEAKLAGRGVHVIAKAKFDDTERLEGDLMDFDFRVIAFPTQASATNYWNEPATKELREARNAVAGVNTFLIAGLPRK